MTIDEIIVTINKRLPERVPCPMCRKKILTMVTRERSSVQWLYCSLLCLVVLLLWPCAYLVFHNENMMNYHHNCPSCHTRIATFNPYLARKREQKEKKKPISFDTSGDTSMLLD